VCDFDADVEQIRIPQTAPADDVPTTTPDAFVDRQIAGMTGHLPMSVTPTIRW
jgi:hypothetical protein